MSTNTMTTPTPPSTYLTQTSLHLSKCFENDPVITFMLNAHPRSKRLALLPGYFHVLIKAAILNNAAITEIDNWSACSVWMPPGKSVDNWATNFQAGFLKVFWEVGGVGVWHTLVDFQSTMDKIKDRELKKYKDKGGYYYLFFIGTLPEAQGRGLGSALIKQWLQKATSENLPIYLEATTTASHALYLKMGFREVEAVRIGKGKAAADGTYEKGGEGVPVWCMIWEPPRIKDVEEGGVSE